MMQQKDKYHELLKNLLVDIVKQKHCRHVIDVDKERNFSLQTKKGKKVFSAFYTPDVAYFRGRKKNMIVFQILSSESKNQKEIFGDLFYAYLSHDVEIMYFICPLEEYDNVMSLTKISESIIKHLWKVKDDYLPEIKIIPIPQKPLNRIQIKKKLIEYAKKENW
jgi:hypothetical protein